MSTDSTTVTEIAIIASDRDMTAHLGSAPGSLTIDYGPLSVYYDTDAVDRLRELLGLVP